jgi:hypothetical protein
VHDPADDVGVPGVDHPAGVLGGDPAVVAEDRGDVGHVVPALDQPLAGVLRLREGHGLGVALEQVGGAQEQVAALARGGRGPASLVEGAVCRRDRQLDIGLGRLVDLAHERPVGGAVDRPPATGRGCGPGSVDIELRHVRRHPLCAAGKLRDLQLIAHAATISYHGG